MSDINLKEMFNELLSNKGEANPPEKKHIVKLMRQSKQTSRKIRLTVAYLMSVPGIRHPMENGELSTVNLRLTLMDIKNPNSSDFMIVPYDERDNIITDFPLFSTIEKNIIPYFEEKYGSSKVKLQFHPELGQAVLLPDMSEVSQKVKLDIFTDYMDYTKYMLKNYIEYKDSVLLSMLGKGFLYHIRAGFIPLWAYWEGDVFKDYKDTILSNMSVITEDLIKGRISLKDVYISRDDKLFWAKQSGDIFRASYKFPNIPNSGNLKPEEISYHFIPFITYEKLRQGQTSLTTFAKSMLNLEIYKNLEAYRDLVAVEEETGII